MKRSQKVQLVLMPFILAGVAGCEPEHPSQMVVFDNPDQCAAFYHKDECLNQYLTAASLHNQMAPQYNTQSECESDFGFRGCESQPSGSYVPMMTAYMMPSPGVPYTTAISTQPLYTSADDPYNRRTASNVSIGQPNKHYNVRPSAAKLYSAGRVSRGGFGATAARHSSGGSFGG